MHFAPFRERFLGNRTFHDRGFGVPGLFDGDGGKFEQQSAEQERP
jgi:hypothetical protein